MYEKALLYCKWAVKKTNKQVPIYVKKQCQLFINIWDDKDNISFFDHNRAWTIEQLLALVNAPKGEGANKTVIDTLTGFTILL